MIRLKPEGQKPREKNTQAALAPAPHKPKSDTKDISAAEQVHARDVLPARDRREYMRTYMQKYRRDRANEMKMLRAKLKELEGK